jgi:purine-binding chemotaxis protein CheW
MSMAVLEKEEQLVAFQLAGETYGIPIALVQEIIRFCEITQIPRTSPAVRGVVNLRGKIVPVIDLRMRFGLPTIEESSSTRIVVVESEPHVVGLIVDAVTQVLRLSAAQIEPPSELVADIQADFIHAVGKMESGLVILLNVSKILQTESFGGEG